MEEREFDKFADEYHRKLAGKLRVSGEEPEFFVEYKIHEASLLVADAETSNKCRIRILDFGAGIGGSAPYFKRYFPDCELTCADVSHRSLQIGKSLHHSQAQFICFDGHTLPFNDSSFNLVFAACVFHHIGHDEHAALIGELFRVVAPGGLLVIFEHNPYNPLTRRVVNNCEFDENAVLIRATDLASHFKMAGFESIRKCYRMFFPRIFRHLRILENHLGWLPLGAQYYVVGKKPKVT